MCRPHRGVGKAARHAAGHQRRQRHHQHIGGKHQGDGGQRLWPDEMAQKQRIGHCETPVHPHHKDDGQGGFGIGRTQSSGQKMVAGEDVISRSPLASRKNRMEPALPPARYAWRMIDRQRCPQNFTKAKGPRAAGVCSPALSDRRCLGVRQVPMIAPLVAFPQPRFWFNPTKGDDRLVLPELFSGIRPPIEN